MITNILAFIFSTVLIDFDNKFVSSEFYSVTSCSSSTNTLYENSPNCNTLKNIITDLTKGQLAGSVIVFVSYLMFVGIYIYTYIHKSIKRWWNKLW